MSAIYFHIPFCKQACHYCDFHFSTSLQGMAAMSEALLRETELRAAERSTPAASVYFGGGTPSLLPAGNLAQLLAQTRRVFGILPDAEITLEANPDDLSPEKLRQLRQLGINRLSIGIQSFHEAHLRWMNRAHNAQEALACVTWAKQAGFDNISIDLIYALPAENHSLWEQDLQTAIHLGVTHISAYCLTIEERTAFGNWLKKGRIQSVDDEFAARQFEIMTERLTAAGFEHYEISNFARSGYYSRHNSNYWKKGTYIGIGPSAHSYNGTQRSYNIANNAKYIKAILSGQLPTETETLTRRDHINEYLMTSLRTQWGADLQWLSRTYGYDLMASQSDYLLRLTASEQAFIKDNHLILTNKGRLLADSIALELFLPDD
ncbi:radical SAM family heme chaperone HemW [Rhodoflexus caldus]|uniref:radical SAM family heme chaperone HemW n=1 Tax=Rhodoflexus caldus TaxID=2891236 RepID=UPI00202AB9B6|nr:radical SAM family heme chaperone HemW [Rhodoflexus caldus]